MLYRMKNQQGKKENNFKISYPEQGLLQLLILKFIYENQSYGYDLIKQIADVSNNSMNIKSGTMYTTLRRMEKGGFIKSVWREGDIGPSKRLYGLTPQGKRYLNKMLHNISNRIPIVQELLSFYKKELDGKI